jgi:hypothetical protein
VRSIDDNELINFVSESALEIIQQVASEINKSKRQICFFEVAIADWNH